MKRRLLHMLTALCFILVCSGCTEKAGLHDSSRVASPATASEPVATSIPDAARHEPSNTKDVELLIFSAVWCEVCREIPDVVKRLRQHYPALKITELDLDEGDNFDLMTDYGGDAVPYMFISVDGERVAKIKGLLPFDKLSERIRLAYAQGKD